MRARTRHLATRALACLFLAFAVQSVLAAEEAERRLVEIGLKIFRTTLAADLNLASKLDQEQHLPIVLFFVADRAAAVRYRQRLAQPGELLEHPLDIVLSDDPTLRDFSGNPPAAIFITESRLAPATLRQLRDFSARHSRLLFSPFEADVRRGVATGLFIGSRVRPFVNLAALRASGVELQAFFLRVAKTTD